MWNFLWYSIDDIVIFFDMDIGIKVGVIITNAEDQVLLIKEISSENTESKWNIVKGTYDGEESIFDAAVRECREEAGLFVELQKSLGVYISENEEKMRVQFNFLAYSDDKNITIYSKKEQELLHENIEDARWFSKKEIMTMECGQFVTQRSFELLHDWINGKDFDLECFKHVHM
jgi:8-oxo-dGTP diphosphatase